MRIQVRIMATLLAVVTIIAILQVAVFASSGGMGFSVDLVIPDNQRGSVSTYFDLLVQPGQQQELTITVSNTSDQDIAVLVGVNPAATNRNGVLIYSTAQPRLDDSLPYHITQLAQVRDQRLEIPVGESRSTAVSLQIPDEWMDGIVLGGIQVIKELSEEELDSDAMIINRYSASTALMLRMEDTVSVVPDFDLGSVQAELTNHRASFVADIHHTRPTIANDVTVSAQIFAKNSSDPAFQVTRSNLTFAPNSIMEMTFVDEAGYGIQAGDYRIKVEITNPDNAWAFEQEFHIAAEAAAAVNQGAINQNIQSRPGGSLPLWAMVAIGTGGVLLAGAVILFVVALRRNSNREIQQMYQKINQQMGANPAPDDREPDSGSLP